MSYDEYKELCKKSWEEDFNYVCIDRSQKSDQGRFCICNESKNTYIECTPETNSFQKHMTLIHSTIIIGLITK